MKSISRHKFWAFRIVWVCDTYRTCTGTGKLDGEIGQVTGSKKSQKPLGEVPTESPRLGIAARGIDLRSLRVDVDRAKTRITHIRYLYHTITNCPSKTTEISPRLECDFMTALTPPSLLKFACRHPPSPTTFSLPHRSLTSRQPLHLALLSSTSPPPKQMDKTKQNKTKLTTRHPPVACTHTTHMQGYRRPPPNQTK